MNNSPFENKGPAVLDKDYRIFQTYTTKKALKGSRKATPFVSIKSNDWVVIVCVDAARDEVVLVEQYRHGSDQTHVEFPCGIIEDGETPEQAALRELQEETGFVPDNEGKLLFSAWANPAFMTNKIHVVLVCGTIKPGETSFDEHENIITRTIPCDRVALELQRGGHAYCMLAWQWCLNQVFDPR